MLFRAGIGRSSVTVLILIMSWFGGPWVGAAVTDQPIEPPVLQFPPSLDSMPLKSPSRGAECAHIPLLMAEGSNSCEIVSCGMGIKDTCKITCPTDKAPKCSCDCLKTFGPICTEYKANCRCE